MLRKSRKVWVWVCFALILVVSLASVLTPKTETLEQAAARFMGCFDRRDTGCMLEYATKQEIAATGLTEENLREFFDKYVDPRLDGFKPAGTSYDLKRSEGIEEVNVGRKYVHPDGRETYHGFTFVQVGGKPKAEIVMRLLYATFRTYVPGELPSGRARHGVWLKAARASMATLEKLELKGYVHPEARSLSPRPTLLRKTLAAVRLGPPVNDRPAEPQDDGIIDCSPFHPWRFAVDFHQSRAPVVTQTVVNVKSK